MNKENEFDNVSNYDTLSNEECINKALLQDKKISSIVNFTAKWINNMKLQYDFVLSYEMLREFETQNLVIVTACSNDSIIFDGAIQKDLVQFEGGEIFFNDENGFTTYSDKTYKELDTNPSVSFPKIFAHYKKEGNPTWKIESTIPYKKIYIWDDTDVYCEGIVFNMNDLK